MNACLHAKRGFSVAWEQFWLDTLPDTTNDAWLTAGCQLRIAGLTTPEPEPQLLFNKQQLWIFLLNYDSSLKSAQLKK